MTKKSTKKDEEVAKKIQKIEIEREWERTAQKRTELQKWTATVTKSRTKRSHEYELIKSGMIKQQQIEKKNAAHTTTKEIISTWKRITRIIYVHTVKKKMLWEILRSFIFVVCRWYL